MSEQEATMSAAGVTHDYRGITQSIFKAQRQLAETRQALQEAEQQQKVADQRLNDIIIDEQLALYPTLSGLKDPTTERSNKDYTAMVLDQKLRQNQRVQDATEQAQAAGTVVQQLKVQLSSDQDFFSAMRSVARMFAATVEYVDNQQSLMEGIDYD